MRSIFKSVLIWFVQQTDCFCLADFVGMTLLACPRTVFLWLPSFGAYRFWLPLAKFLFIVCLSMLFVFYFLPLTNSALPGTANSNKSEPTCFGAEVTYLPKTGLEVLPSTCASAANPFPRCRPLPTWKKVFTSFEAINL